MKRFAAFLTIIAVAFGEDPVAKPQIDEAKVTEIFGAIQSLQAVSCDFSSNLTLAPNSHPIYFLADARLQTTLERIAEFWVCHRVHATACAEAWSRLTSFFFRSLLFAHVLTFSVFISCGPGPLSKLDAVETDLKALSSSFAGITGAIEQVRSRCAFSWSL